MRTNRITEKTGISLDRLETFAAVAEAGSIVAAAGGRNVSRSRQSLFSRQIADLEEYFQTKLFNRDSKRLVLTPAGRRLEPIIRQHLRAMDEFAAGCRNEHVRFRLAAGNSVLNWMVLGRIDGIQRRHPQIELDLIVRPTADVIHGLRNLLFDFGIIRADDAAKADGLAPPLKSNFLASTGYGIFVAKDLLKKARTDDPARVLERLPVATSVGGQFRELLEASAHEEGIRFRVALACSSFALAARAAHAGTCAAVLPDLARCEFTSPAYARLDLPVLQNHRRHLHLVWHSGSPGIRPELKDLCKTLIASLVDEV